LPLAGTSTPLTITALYNDPNNNPNKNFVTSQDSESQVVLNGDNTSLSVSASTVAPGTNVTFKATVTASTTPKPSGDGSTTGVIFYDGLTALNTTPVALNSSGVAQIDTNTLGVSLAAGTHPIKAVYTGDDNYVSSNASSTVRVTDNSVTSVTAASSSS